MSEQVDKRVEYQVIGEDGLGVRGFSELEFAREEKARLERVVGQPHRIQKSHVTESRTPWEDVADV